MKFVYSGTTWTPGNAEYPNYPIVLGEKTDSDLRHTMVDGSTRKHTNWKKPTYGLSWTNCGSVVRDHVQTWPDLDTDIVFYSKYGTTACKAVADSYSFDEVTMDNYTGGITLIGS